MANAIIDARIRFRPQPRPGNQIIFRAVAGLMHRVKLVEAHLQELPTVAERLAFARQHFGLGQPPAPSELVQVFPYFLQPVGS